MATILREFLARDEIDGEKLPDGMTLADLLIRKLYKAAGKGDMRAMAIIWERNDGKVPDIIQGDPNKPLKIVVEYADLKPPEADD